MSNEKLKAQHEQIRKEKKWIDLTTNQGDRYFESNLEVDLEIGRTRSRQKDKRCTMKNIAWFPKMQKEKGEEK